MSFTRAALVLPLLLAVPGAPAAASGYPELCLILAPGQLALNASYEEQLVTFEGTAAVDNPSGSEIDVYIVARNSALWWTSCTPKVFTVRGTGSVPFQLSVRVPASSCNRSVESWVEGEARFNGNLVGTNQSQRVTLAIGPLPRGATDQGRDSSWLSSTFGVKGNAPFTLAAIIAALAAAALSGWGVARRRRRRGRKAAGVTEGT